MIPAVFVCSDGDASCICTAVVQPQLRNDYRCCGMTTDAAAAAAVLTL